MNGEVDDLDVVGKIQGYSGSGGRYRWLVAFKNNTKRFFECQEPVRLIVDSKKGRIDVTCSATTSNKEGEYDADVDDDATTEM